MRTVYGLGIFDGRFVMRDKYGTDLHTLRGDKNEKIYID